MSTPIYVVEHSFTNVAGILGRFKDPIVYGGALYIPVDDFLSGPGTPRTGMAKSTDSGQTWALLDSANSHSYRLGCAAAWYSGTGSIVDYTWVDASTHEIKLSTFDLATGLFGSVISGGPVTTGGAFDFGMDLNKLSNGTLQIAYQDPQDGGSGHNTLNVVEYSSGWGSPILIAAGDVTALSINNQPLSMAVDNSDITHMLYMAGSDGTTRYARMHYALIVAGVKTSDTVIVDYTDFSASFFFNFAVLGSSRLYYLPVEGKMILASIAWTTATSPTLPAGLYIVKIDVAAFTVSFEAVDVSFDPQVIGSSGAGFIFSPDEGNYFVFLIYVNGSFEQVIDYYHRLATDTPGVWDAPIQAWNSTLDPPPDSPSVETMPFGATFVDSTTIGLTPGLQKGICGTTYYLATPVNIGPPPITLEFNLKGASTPANALASVNPGGGPTPPFTNPTECINQD